MSRSRVIGFVVLLAWVCFSGMGWGRNEVRLEVDSAQFLIGKQVKATFTYTPKSGHEILLPLKKDTLAEGIEILNYKRDTIRGKGENLYVREEYMISAYDSGVYYIPELQYIDITTKDTFTSNPYALRVYSPNVEIDTTDMTAGLMDIKPIIAPPFPWRYAFRIAGWTILILLVLGALGWIGWRLWNRKGILPHKEVPPKDPYEVAIEKLNQLEADEEWKNGQEKQFQSELTDIVRTYLEIRMNFTATEMTTTEILQALDESDEGKDIKERVARLLNEADGVKFAGQELSPLRHKECIKGAREIIEQIKPKEEEKTLVDNENKMKE